MEKIIAYVKVIVAFIDMGVSFNTSIDEEGNTPMMFFSMIEDWVSMAYLILNCKDLDLSMKNKKGESFSSICLNHKPIKQSNYSGINTKYLMYTLFSHPTFDSGYRDPTGNNVLMHYMIHYPENYECNFNDVLKSHKEFLTVPNNNQENLLIVATKLRRHDVIKNIVQAKGNDVNHQDILGNTALHYAVLLRDLYMVNLLALHHADINIKNKKEQSPINMVRESNDSTMLKFILKPCSTYQFQQQVQKCDSSSLHGKSYEFNEGLKTSYQEVYNVNCENNKKSNPKYLPNITPKYNTEYYVDVFKAYFPVVVNSFNSGSMTYVEIPPPLSNMLINKDILKYNNQYVIY